MRFSLAQTSSMERESLLLQIAPDDQELGWELADRHSNAIARYQAYLNWLSVKTFLPWVEEWALEEELPNPSIWPSEATLLSILELVNGTAIQLGKTRLILIPSDEIEPESLIVPQEWVDNPNWIGDYYLAVKVSLEGDEDDCWLEVEGFATHRQVKNQGKYDANNRSYSVPLAELTEDLTVMEITLGLQVREAVKPLPQLSEIEAKQWLEQLGDASLYSPRLQLQVPFEKWAALLTDDRLRQQLCDRRMGQLETVAAKTTPVKLREWLENVLELGKNTLEDGWQQFEALVSPPEPSAVRGKGDVVGAIAPVIRLLEPHQIEQTRRHAAGVLGELGVGNPEAIDALIQLLHTARDEETRWQAALSLGKVSPGHPQAGIRKARYLDFGMQLEGHSVALIVAIMPRNDDKLGVFLQVQPIEGRKLPPHLKLSVLSESGETKREVETRSDEEGEGTDNLIQLRFSPRSGTRFQVRVSLNEVSITEEFVA
ncbi:DUF1822 family protein [Laspinema olomoucense]|uniref:DUF1822 family protein n=1 Tax=Laspinema olomoucense D3b TaxID=2953688 RepID=A0ABT2NE91_9CYAN|nr:MULTISPECIES: DUF1822 family protein [unclassified Laspinema]MCT7979655.1 DUF1822 family protein [Laspinema sp. D3b]MCT7996106.1 DUF1822 family protein [Laspinema sp. D3c]